ncbi:MAG: PKD domain-containing protein [Thermoplasmata archaeon]|nr:PKD domain-containing protein [Thermoplasmata archaeon]
MTLRVTDSIGTTATDTTWVDILNKNPVAAFTYSPADPDTSDDIEFVDTSTDPDGTIASWSWDFGDGGTSTDNNPTHSYADDGEYVVTLNVTDNDGATNETSHPITVLNVGPIASFNVSPAEPIVDKEAQFTDTSTDSDGDVVAWEWDFGDGQTSDVENPTHQYDEVGEYNVTLKVTDDDGDDDTAEVTITVKESEPPGNWFADYWWVVAIIIVIIAALVLILLMRRQKPAEETPPPEETGPP